MIRCYATACVNPDCRVNEVFTDEDLPIGGWTDCDCGAAAQRLVAPLAPIGIMVEYHDVQASRTFRSNAEYKDYLNHGLPVLDGNGEQIGEKPIRELSHDEVKKQQLRIREGQERSAQKSGMSWEAWKVAVSQAPQPAKPPAPSAPQSRHLSP